MTMFIIINASLFERSCVFPGGVFNLKERQFQHQTPLCKMFHKIQSFWPHVAGIYS
jgi:hypothetical protein